MSWPLPGELDQTKFDILWLSVTLLLTAVIFNNDVVGSSTSLVFTSTWPQCGAKMIRFSPVKGEVEGETGSTSGRRGKKKFPCLHLRSRFRCSPLLSPFNHLTPPSRATNHPIQFSVQNVTCWNPAKWSHYSKKWTYLLDEMPWAFPSNLA